MLRDIVDEDEVEAEDDDDDDDDDDEEEDAVAGSDPLMLIGSCVSVVVLVNERQDAGDTTSDVASMGGMIAVTAVDDIFAHVTV